MIFPTRGVSLADRLRATRQVDPDHPGDAHEQPTQNRILNHPHAMRRGIGAHNSTHEKIDLSDNESLVDFEPQVSYPDERAFS